MSSMTRESQNTTATIWYKRSSGVSMYDPVTYEPKLIEVCFAIGGESKYKDQQGSMIVPKSRYWFEASAGIELPKRGDYIARGDHLGELDPTALNDAEDIRFTRLDDLSLLNEIDDFYLET